MRLIVGLGNPGAAYAQTRHNIGMLAIERAAARWSIRLAKRGMAHRGSGRLGSELLELAGTLALVALLVPLCRQWPALAGAVAAAVVAVLAHSLPLRLGLLCGVVVGIASWLCFKYFVAVLIQNFDASKHHSNGLIKMQNNFGGRGSQPRTWLWFAFLKTGMGVRCTSGNEN